MADGKRYEGQSKLNIKKVIAIVVALLVIIMVFISMQKILSIETTKEVKIVNVDYYPVYTNGLWGVIDANGDIVISPEYEEMIVIPNNQKPVFIVTYDLNVSDMTYKTKAINENNELLFTDYDRVEILDNHDKSNSIYYEKSILKVLKDGKYGVINYDGKEVIKCEYDEIIPATGLNNILIVKKDGKYGVINGLGTTIISPEYDSVTPLSTKPEDGYIIRNEDGYGIALTSKKIIISPQYKEIKKVTGNDMYVVKDNTWKIVNKSNETILEVEFDDVTEINGQNVSIVKDGKHGLISTEGNMLIPVEYDSLKYAFDNYYIVSKEGKYGIVDTSNYSQLNMIYSSIVYRTDAGFIEAENSDFETEIYDKNLELKLKGIISEVNIEDGYIRVWQGDNYKYYNFKFEEKSNIDVLKGKNLYLSKKNGKYGYIDKNEKVIVDYIYDDAQEQNKYGYCAVKKDGKWGTLDRQGKVNLEPMYELKSNTKFDFIGKWHIGRDLNMNYYTDVVE